MEFSAVAEPKKIINELLQKIIVLSVAISVETEADVFCWYSGHVNCLSVNIYKTGWTEKRLADEALYFEADNEEGLTKIFNYLKEFYRGKKGDGNGCLELSFAPDVVNR